MSTHRRAWSQRAGVVVALVTGALLTVPATPALAATINVSPGSVTINAGSDTTVSVTVTPSPEDKNAQVGVTGLPSGVSCNGCGTVNFNGPPGTPKRVLLTLRANDNAPDGNNSATVQVQPDQSDPATAPLSVTVKAKAAPTTQPPETQTVKSISGKVVVAANGDAVPNAVVMLRDSQGHQYQTTSDGSGNWRFTGSSSQPIAPGRIDLGASKGTEAVNTKVINASAGQSLTGQRISLPIKVEVSPSATPSSSVEPVPTEEVTEEATDTSVEATPGQPQAASNDDGGGMGSFLVILLGGLLVAAGVGTIVLLWMRRKNADDEDGVAAAPVGAAAGARGGLRGADDQTRVVNRVGAGPDPTMVGGTSLSDAPTMMHRPIVDDVPPDPYGAPPQPYGAGAAAGGWAGSGYGDEPAQGGYGQPGGYGNAPASGAGYGNAPSSGGGYGNAPASGGGYGNEPGYDAAGAAAGSYGNAPSSGAGYGNAPASGAGYGNAPASGGDYGNAPGAGYGNDYGAPAGGAGYAGQDQGGGYGERYDEPTGRYTGESTGNYTPPADPYPTSTYQPEQGYGQSEPGYGQEPTGGYRGGNGYGPQGGGYDAGPQQGYDNGYDQRGGYDQQTGYAGQAGYDQANGYAGHQGGYDQQQGGYDQQPPQQRGYDAPGYDQQQGGGYYGDQAPAGRARPDVPPAQDRGGRRLDWLDD